MVHSPFIPLHIRKAWMEEHGIRSVAEQLFAQIILHVQQQQRILGSDVTPIVFSDIDETLIYNHMIGDYHETTGKWMSTTSQWQLWESEMNPKADATVYPAAHQFLTTLKTLGAKVVLVTNSWNRARVEGCLNAGNIRRGALFEDIYIRHDEYSLCKQSRFTSAYYAMQERYGSVALLASLGDAQTDDASAFGGKFFLFPNAIYRDCPYFAEHIKLPVRLR
jgi:predicted secreted acid phosphatase